MVKEVKVLLLQNAEKDGIIVWRGVVCDAAAGSIDTTCTALQSRLAGVHTYIGIFENRDFPFSFPKEKKKFSKISRSFFFLISVSSDPKRCLHVDERPERIDKSAFSKIPVYCGCSLRWKQLHHTTLCVMSSEACSTGGFVHICTAESLWLHFCAGFQLCVQT